MYTEHIARAFIEAAAVITIGIAIYKQDAINQFEDELKNKIKARLLKWKEQNGTANIFMV